MYLPSVYRRAEKPAVAADPSDPGLEIADSRRRDSG